MSGPGATPAGCIFRERDAESSLRAPSSSFGLVRTAGTQLARVSAFHAAAHH